MNDYSATKETEFDNAIKLMNNYVETIAVPFIPTKKQSSLTKRLKALYSDEEIPEQLNIYANGELAIKHGSNTQNLCRK